MVLLIVRIFNFSVENSLPRGFSGNKTPLTFLYGTSSRSSALDFSAELVKFSPFFQYFISVSVLCAQASLPAHKQFQRHSHVPYAA